MVPDPTFIYHFTHINNLPLILAAGGLRTCGALRQAGVNYQDVAYATLQDHRARKPVTCGRGGTLHDYVPFYFCPLSPMLFTISKGNVPGYDEGTRPLIFFVSSAQAIQQAGLPFVFTDGHGIMDYTDFYDDLDQLQQVDWPLMSAKMWNSTEADPDRKRRRSAEFLVHEFLPWNLITHIGTRSSLIQATVLARLAGMIHQPEMLLRPDWYY